MWLKGKIASSKGQVTSEGIASPIATFVSPGRSIKVRFTTAFTRNMQNYFILNKHREKNKVSRHSITTHFHSYR